MSVVTCRTVDCPARDQPREMVLSWVDAEGAVHTVDSVVCGGCSQPITDIR